MSVLQARVQSWNQNHVSEMPYVFDGIQSTQEAFVCQGGSLQCIFQGSREVATPREGLGHERLQEECLPGHKCLKQLYFWPLFIN